MWARARVETSRREPRNHSRDLPAPLNAETTDPSFPSGASNINRVGSSYASDDVGGNPLLFGVGVLPSASNKEFTGEALVRNQNVISCPG